MRPVLTLGVALTILGFSAPALAAPPVVVITAPTSAAEGAGVALSVAVSDPDGDPVTFIWDLDGDAAFDDFPNLAEITTPPLPSDDPSITIRVHATDGVEFTVASEVIAIMNVPPTVTSEPSRTAAVRQPYSYEVRVDDPAGDRDVMSYRLTSRPVGMEITGNHITWTPDPDQRGREVRVILRLDDGDGGEASQTWTIAVEANQTPGIPSPVAPVDRARVEGNAAVTLTVENASDLDEDPLVYHFDLSRTATFEGELISSEGVPEQEGGETSWTTDTPIPAGLWYWRVSAFDGMAESEPRYAQVVVGDVGFMADAGPGGGSGGCTIARTTESRGPRGLLVIAIAGLIGLIVRRR